MRIPEKDIKIISKLRNNARESLTTMSRATGIPVSTIFDRLKYHEGGIIRRHTCLIDFEQLGYPTRAKATVKVKKETRDDLKSFLSVHPNVNSLYKINSGYDFMFELIFSNIKELEDFMEMIEEKYGITEKNIYYIIDDIRREAFMSDGMCTPN